MFAVENYAAVRQFVCKRPPGAVQSADLKFQGMSASMSLLGHPRRSGSNIAPDERTRLPRDPRRRCRGQENGSGAVG